MMRRNFTHDFNAIFMIESFQNCKPSAPFPSARVTFDALLMIHISITFLNYEMISGRDLIHP